MGCDPVRISKNVVSTRPRGEFLSAVHNHSCYALANASFSAAKRLRATSTVYPAGNCTR